MKSIIIQNIDDITQALNQLSTENLAGIHIYDPYDVQKLFERIRDELQKDPVDVDATMLVEFLAFHRANIKPSLVGHIQKILNYAYADAIRRVCRTVMMDVTANAEDDISAVVGRLMEKGDEDVISRLLSSTSGDDGADICVALGDYVFIHCEDVAGALDLYRKSLDTRPNHLAVCQRVLALLEHQNAWREACDMLDCMINVADNEDEVAKYLCKKGWILLEKSKDSAHAIECFNQVLEIRPTYYDIFLKINEILLAQKDLSGIENNFCSMIERQKKAVTASSELLSVLYRDHGEFRLQKFNDVAGAIASYKLLSDLHFDNIQFHLLLARLYEMDERLLRDALNEYRRCLALNLETLPALSGLARCYRKLGMFDESLCTYRVLNALHFNDEEGDDIVRNFADTEVPEISEELSNELWAAIIPETLDMTLVQIFAICSGIIGDMFSNYPSTYGIDERRSRIDVSENTTFNNIIRSETRALGFGEVPLLYRCERFSGVTNAFFSERSFLIHPNCLKGRSLKELSFMTAKAMMLIRPEYYLLSLGIKNVELLLMAIIKTIRPDSFPTCTLDKNQLQVSEKLVERLSVEECGKLYDLIDEINRHKGFNVLLFMESVEDLANRVALLFCDDPTIVEKLLGEEPAPISSRTMHSRMKTLMRWALSEDYFALRKKLNIALKV